MTRIEVDYNERDGEGRVIAGVSAGQLHGLREGQTVTLYDPIDRLQADATVAWIEADVHAVGFDVDWTSFEDEREPQEEGPSASPGSTAGPKTSLVREPGRATSPASPERRLEPALSVGTNAPAAPFPRRGVFISYRREDTGSYARLLKTFLSERLPDTPVFMDLDSIEPGSDFTEAIESALRSSGVLIALIGRRWLRSDDEGQRRVDSPEDYVRFEIQAALARRVRVLPVLVDGARAPLRQQLPDDLRKLAQLNTLELSHGRFEFDEGRLMTTIQNVLASAVSDRST
jgi:hypothetical protein